jgi:hypothetical protein
MRAALAAAVLAGLVLAGCAGTTTTTRSTAPAGHTTVDALGQPARPQAAIWADVRAALASVPCDATVSTDAAVNSGNLKLLSSIAIPTSVSGEHAELDIRGDLAVHALYDHGGFELYDIHDPLAPAHLVTWNASQDDNALDVKFSPDNATVLIGHGSTIELVDVRDPLHPHSVGNWSRSEATPLGGQATQVGYNSHMLYTKRIAGQDWVFLAPNANSGVWVLKLTGGPDHPKLTYVTQTLPVEGGPIGPHDLYVQKDALDGHWYLYSADGFEGWLAFNVDDPAKPTPAGGFPNPAEGAYTHTIQAQVVNGKRIVATIAEIGADFLRVYDATTMAAPVLLGAWQAETTPQGAASPEHNFNIVDGKLYLSNYGHGLYVFDLKAFTAGPSLPAVGTLALKPVAHWAVGTETIGESFSGVWDTLVKDGVIYVSHIEGGLVVLGYGCNKELPDPKLTSDG